MTTINEAITGDDGTTLSTQKNELKARIQELEDALRPFAEEHEAIGKLLVYDAYSAARRRVYELLKETP